MKEGSEKEKMRLRRKLYWIILTVLLTCTVASGTAFARAGGGSSGGGGSSSGGHSSSHHYIRGGTGDPVELLIMQTLFFLLASGGSIVFVYRTRKARKKSVRLMKEYSRLGINWDYKKIQKRVEKAYFEVQECWRRYDTSYAEEYLSEELRQEWQTKLEWMKIRREEIVQKKVKLLSAVPVHVYDEDGEENDKIWYLIHGKMIGYYRNIDTKELIRGNPKKEAFYEYWLFVRREGKWVLHQIRQKEEMDICEFL